MSTDDPHEATPQNSSSQASIFALSVLIAALTLIFHGGVIWFVVVWVGSFTLFSITAIWGWAAQDRKIRESKTDFVLKQTSLSPAETRQQIFTTGEH